MWKAIKITIDKGHDITSSVRKIQLTRTSTDGMAYAAEVRSSAQVPEQRCTSARDLQESGIPKRKYRVG